MGPKSLEIYGWLLARSPVITSEKQGFSMLLDLRTLSGQKVKIIVRNIYLEDRFAPGKFYKLSNLHAKRIVEMKNTIIFEFGVESVVEAEITGITKDIPNLNENRVCGKVTAADDDFGIFEIDGCKNIVLTYMREYFECPVLKVGDEVDVMEAHLYHDSKNKSYYVLCIRSFLRTRPGTPEERKHPPISAFIRCAEIYALNIQSVLWLRETKKIVETCVNDNLLKSLGAPKNSVVYADVLLMLLSSNEEIKKRVLSSFYVRQTFSEFFDEPHSCIAVQEQGPMPPKPINLKECLALQKITDIPEYKHGDGWNYHTLGIPDDHPILGYVGISDNDQRLCLMDGSGTQVTLVPVNHKDGVNLDCSSIYGKIVLLRKSFLVREEYLDNCAIDPASEVLPASTHKFIYLIVNLEDVTILGPDCNGFSQWTRMKFFENVEQKRNGISNSLLPLQSSCRLQTYTSERYLVLHKSPLQSTGAKDHMTYLMTKKLPGQTGNISSGTDIFMKLQSPHSYFYHVIPSSGEIEIRFPEGKSDSIHRQRSYLPHTTAIRNKLKTSLYIPMPAEVEMYIATPSRRLPSEVYSVSEAVSNVQLNNELFNLAGTVVRRTQEEGTFQREMKIVSNDSSFGLPGRNSVIILDLCDDGSADTGMGGRVYLSWHKHYQYPLGLLPGASIVITFVCRATSTENVYFRATNLSSIELIKPAQPDRAVKNNDFVELPTGRWIRPEAMRPGGRCWCPIDSPSMSKLEAITVCKNCGDICSGGVCTFPGCSSSLGPTVKLSAHISMEDINGKLSIFVGDTNARVLLKVPEKVLQALVTVVNHTGPLYSKRYRKMDINTAGLSQIAEYIFDDFSSNAIDFGAQYHGYCRRFKSNQTSTSPDLFCVNLLPACPRRTILNASSPAPPSNKRAKLN